MVKAFNTTYAGTLLAGEVAGEPLDVFIVGDDADAKNKVAELVRDGGMRPIDTGPLGSCTSNRRDATPTYHTSEYSGHKLGSTIKILS